ncbi:MAG: Crp/Fnr family transcriptional regulator [Alphaproteobacteria bacterium]|uniref:Crp/Fnr family transcriptional regulator n=1 Tax=Candidatus Nitrobium versatile TaxID=2884831 RepID=A0A953JCT2_9BACT|nr:Crp/Fnr family transcriptional regulator [Candidatus Nitrobium versatile]
MHNADDRRLIRVPSARSTPSGKRPLSRSREARNERLVRTTPLFDCLSDEEFGALRHICHERHFPKGKVILSEEDTYHYMYIVLSGKVKAVHFSPDGKEHILAIHKRGDFFGEMALLDGKTSPASVVAMEDSEIVLISGSDFQGHLLQSRKVCEQLIFLLCARLRESWMVLKVLSLPEAAQRVRAVLRMVSLHHGAQDSRGTIITVKLTHQDIAGYASVSRETVTRILNRLIREGEIEILENRSILLKPSFVS